MRDFTLQGFAEHLAASVGVAHTAAKHALEDAAKVVEKEAKAEIGHYQGEARPFVAWAELADSTKDERARLGYSENEPGLREGDMRDSIGHAVEMTGALSGEAQVGSNDDKMLWFELGTAKQPPRSVLGMALVHKTDEVVHILGENIVKALVGEGVSGGYLPI